MLSVTPHVYVFQGADRPIENCLAHTVEVRVAAALHTHLGSHLVLVLQVISADHAGFIDTVRQRFFAVDVHSSIQRPVSDERVSVIGRAADDCINVFLVEAFAPINVVLGTGENLGGFGESLFVDVAQGDHVFFSDGLKVRPAPASCANDGDV